MDQSNNGEDLMTLEAEITELQRENARVESQMIKLKSDINAMENHLNHGEKVKLFFIISFKLLRTLSSIHNNLRGQ